MKFRAWMLFIAVGMEYSQNLPIKADAMLTGNESTQQKQQINFLLTIDDKKSLKTHKLDADMESNLDQHLRIKRTVGKCLIRMSKAIDRKIQILKKLQKALHRPSENVNSFKNINLSDVVSDKNGQLIKVNSNEDKHLVTSDQKQNDDLVEKFKQSAPQLAHKSRAITNLFRQEFYKNLTSSIFNNSKGEIETKGLTNDQMSSIKHHENIVKNHSDNNQLDHIGKKDQLQIYNTENKDQPHFHNIERNFRNEVSDNRGKPADVNFNKDKNLMNSGQVHNDDLMDNLKQLAHKSRQIANLVRQDFYKNPTSSIFNHTRVDIKTKTPMKEENNKIGNKDQDQFDNIKKKDPRQLDYTENKDRRQSYRTRTEKNLRDDVNDHKGQASEANFNQNKKLLKIGQEYNDKIKSNEVIFSRGQPSEVNLNENKNLRKSDREHNDYLIERFKQLADKVQTNMNLRRQELNRNLTSSIFNPTSDDIITKPLTEEEVSLTNHNGNNMKNPNAREWISEARLRQEVEYDESTIGSRKDDRKYYKKIDVKERVPKFTNKAVKMKCICEAINEASNELPRFKRDLQQFQGDHRKQTVETSRNRKSSKSSKHLQKKRKFKHHTEDMQSRSKSSINYNRKNPRKRNGNDKFSSSIGSKKRVQQKTSVKYISQSKKTNGEKLENLLSRFVKINSEIQRLMTLYALYEEKVKQNKIRILEPSSSSNKPSDITQSNVKTSEGSYQRIRKIRRKDR